MVPIFAAWSMSLVLQSPGDGPVPKVPLGKETTYLTGPLDNDGCVDYLAATNEAIGKGVTPEKNAVVLIWQGLGPHPKHEKKLPAEYFKRLGIGAPPEKGDYFIELEDFLKQSRRLNDDELFVATQQSWWAQGQPWTANEFPNIASWLQSIEKPLKCVVEASRRPEYYCPLFSNETPPCLASAFFAGLTDCRAAIAALHTRAMLRIGNGEMDAAWQDLLACHRLARLIGRGPTTIEALYCFGIENTTTKRDLAFIERANINSAQWRDRQRELTSLLPVTPLVELIDRNERFSLLETLRFAQMFGLSWIPDLSGEHLSFPSKSENKKELAILAKVDLEPAYRATNQWVDRAVAASRLEIRSEREKEFDKIRKDVEALGKQDEIMEKLTDVFEGKAQPYKSMGKDVGNILAIRMLPLIHSFFRISDQNIQMRRNLHVAVALAAYRSDNRHYPESLEELVPKYIASIPNDFFTNQPPIYRPNGAGYRLYSVGPNGKDDDGRSWPDIEHAGADDIGIEIPVPARKVEKPPTEG